MSTANSEFPQQLIESWRDLYDLDQQDIDRAQKLWQEKVVKDNWAPELILNQLEDSLKDRNQRVQAFKDEICEFVKLHYPLDEAFLKALDQKRTELAEKFGNKKLGKLSDRFTDTTSIVNLRQHYLQRYEQKVCELAQQHQSFQFSPDDRASLKDLQQELDITDKIADRIERDLKRQEYRDRLSKMVKQTGKRPNDAFWETLLMGCGLAKIDVQDIDQQLLAGLPPASSPPIVQPAPPPTPPPVSLGRGVIPNEPVVTLEPKPSPKPPLWMYSAVGAGLVFVGLAAAVLTRLPQLAPSASSSPQPATPVLPSQLASIVNDVVNQIDATVVATEKALLAQKSLTNQQLIGSIDRLNQVPVGSPHRQEAQKLKGTACTKLQTSVFSLFNTGKFADADAVVNKAMPCTDLKGKWGIAKQQWNQNEKSLTAANTAFDNEEWDKAIAVAEKVSGNNFQKQKAQEIIREAEDKRPKPSDSSTSSSDTSSSDSGTSSSDTSSFDSGTSSSSTSSSNSDTPSSSNGTSTGTPDEGTTQLSNP